MGKIGYARISSADQNISRQLEQLQDCEKIFREAASGASKERPQLQALLEYIREGDIVVVSELERLGRNNKELTEVMNDIQAKGATLEVVTSIFSSFITTTTVPNFFPTETVVQSLKISIILFGTASVATS